MTAGELPGIIPFRVHESFIDSFVREWESICLSSFRHVERILQQVTHKLRTKHFGRFRSSGLLFKVEYIMALTDLTSRETANAMLAEAATETRKTIQEYCKMESLRPMTLHTEEYKKAQEENVTVFAAMRHGDNPLPSINGHPFTLEDRHGYSRDFNATETTLLSVLAHFGLTCPRQEI
jgi:hypothetical protein